MEAYESKFERVLKKSINELRNDTLEKLALGVDTEKYKYWVGFIHGLDDVFGLIEEARRKINSD